MCFSLTRLEPKAHGCVRNPLLFLVLKKKELCIDIKIEFDSILEAKLKSKVDNKKKN